MAKSTYYFEINKKDVVGCKSQYKNVGKMEYKNVGFPLIPPQFELPTRTGYLLFGMTDPLLK